VGPRADLNTDGKEKILCLCRGSNSDRPVVQPVARHYTALATRLDAVDYGQNSLYKKVALIFMILTSYNNELERTVWMD
jgi:hypothetical protein